LSRREKSAPPYSRGCAESHYHPSLPTQQEMKMPATKGEILDKLKQIEEHARTSLAEWPNRLSSHRLTLIIGLSKYLRTEIELNKGML
jgi:hypothetical protein